MYVNTHVAAELKRLADRIAKLEATVSSRKEDQSPPEGDREAITTGSAPRR